MACKKIKWHKVYRGASKIKLYRLVRVKIKKLFTIRKSSFYLWVKSNRYAKKSSGVRFIGELAKSSFRAEFEK